MFYIKRINVSLVMVNFKEELLIELEDLIDFSSALLHKRELFGSLMKEVETQIFLKGCTSVHT